MLLSAPKSIRDTFNLFARYRQDGNVSDLTQYIDWSHVTPHQVYYSTLNRHPESAAVSVKPIDYSARDHFINVLHAEEFQSSIAWLLLRAYPEKKRILFVHIPKCAGTDLIDLLSQRHPHVDSSLGNPDWTDKQSLFNSIGEISNRLLLSNSIFYSGHVSLRSLIEDQIYRFGDELFTIIREPTGRLISEANYILNIISSEGYRPDKEHWIKQIGLNFEDAERLGRFSPEKLFSKILYCNNLVATNRLCHLLGALDAKTALDLAVSSNIEVVDITHYGEWINSKWGVRESARLNTTSYKFRRSDLSDRDLDYISGKCYDDIILYDTIRSVMDRAGGHSIFGSQIFEG